MQNMCPMLNSKLLVEGLAYIFTNQVCGDQPRGRTTRGKSSFVYHILME